MVEHWSVVSVSRWEDMLRAWLSGRKSVKLRIAL
jgi:hypothetical protein